MKKTEKYDQVAESAIGLPQAVVGTALVPAVVREIPPVPGGGSYTFDEESWAWVSNDPVVETPVTTQE